MKKRHDEEIGVRGANLGRLKMRHSNGLGDWSLFWRNAGFRLPIGCRDTTRLSSVFSQYGTTTTSETSTSLVRSAIVDIKLVIS